MISGKTVGVVIPAAGSGIRLSGGVAKQFLPLEGKPILAWTLNQFQSHPLVDYIAIAGSVSGIETIASIVQSIQATKVVWIGEGGAMRQDSVWNALQPMVERSVEIVLVHDAVRPFVGNDIIERVIRAADQTGAAIPVIRPKDTIKIADAQNVILQTPERERLWMAQTPQGFSLDNLLTAFENARKSGFTGTDDSSLVERIGVKVTLVEGSYNNIKITTPEDLELAKQIALNRM